MTTITDIVAAVVVHSSAVALSHFGVTMEATQIEHPQVVAERVVARTPKSKVVKLSQCPGARAPQHERPAAVTA